MANDFFNATGNPSTSSSGSSSTMRTEFANIAAGFDKLPGLTGNGLELVRVNAGETALESVPVSTAVDIGAMTAAATGKSTPVDGDSLPLSDSAASNAFKKVTWANIKATLASTFAALAGSSTQVFSVAAATAVAHAVRADQVQSQSLTAFTTGGTSTAYTLTPSPAITANTTNQRFRVAFHTAAGATPTLAVSGQTAKNLKYKDSTGTKQSASSTQIPASWIADVEYDGTDWMLLDVPPSTASAAVCAAVRQTISGGPTDSSGFPNLSGSTGSTTVTTSNISSTAPLAVAAAYGFDNATGKALDYFGFSTSNLSWTGLSTNGTMYLYVDVNTTTGALTTGSTTLAPTYQWGGTYSTTNNQNTYNIQDGQMKVGNGSTASQVARVFVGQVTVSGGVVTAIKWYSYQGSFVSAEFGLAASTAYTQSHNIGHSVGVETSLFAINKTTEGGWAVGDRFNVSASSGNYQNGYGIIQSLDADGVTSTVVTAANLQYLNKTTGANAALTVGNWKLILHARRVW